MAGAVVVVGSAVVVGLAVVDEAAVADDAGAVVVAGEAVVDDVLDDGGDDESGADTAGRDVEDWAARWDEPHPARAKLKAPRPAASTKPARGTLSDRAAIKVPLPP